MKVIIIFALIIALCQCVTYKEYTLCLLRNKCISYNCDNTEDLECARAVHKFGECNRSVEKCK
jgi:hypothetical protein